MKSLAVALGAKPVNVNKTGTSRRAGMAASKQWTSRKEAGSAEPPGLRSLQLDSICGVFGAEPIPQRDAEKEFEMAGSVNKVILVGNVGKDPEIRRTQDGRAIANLSLATSETWRDKNTGERKEKTEWHRVVVFNDNLCKVVEQYVRKGSKLYIEGQLQTRK